MLHEQIRTLAGLLASGVASQWAELRHHPDDELGEANGHGTSIAPSEGDQPASGREADLDQPFLSRDDEGMGRAGDAPSKYTGPTGRGPLASAMQQPSADIEPPASFAGRSLEPQMEIKPPAPKAAPKPVSEIEGAGPKVASNDSAAKPETQVADATPPDPTPAEAPAAKPAVATNAMAMNNAPTPPSPARQPGLPVQSADPAPKSDSEIDPFSQNSSAEIRAGKMVVRSGRKAKLTRPRMSLAGFWDGVGLGRAAVTMKLTIDPDGKVIRAEVLQSSGSNEIDNPIGLEAYNWWFEPN